MVSIGPKAEDRPNRNPHNKVVKDTISKFACIRSAPAALDLSSLTKGTSRATIFADLAKATVVLCWFDNILAHLEKAKGNFQKQC